MTSNELLVGVSNRHVHLSRADLDQLFGEEHELQVKRMLRQSGQFAAEEKVTLVGEEEMEVRVVGPLRPQTQVEILEEDKERLGINAPTKISGDLTDTPGISLKGPKGEVVLNEGVIVAAKHVHMSSDEVEEFDLFEVKSVDLEINEKVFSKVPLRIGNKHLSEFHLDKDEAEKLAIKNGQKAMIIKRHE